MLHGGALLFAEVLQGRVYALGGHDNGEYCSELERHELGRCEETPLHRD